MSFQPNWDAHDMYKTHEIMGEFLIQFQEHDPEIEIS